MRRLELSLHFAELENEEAVMRSARIGGTVMQEGLVAL